MKNLLSEADTRSLKKRSILGQILGAVGCWPCGLGLYGYQTDGHVVGTTLYSMTVVWLMITLGALLVIFGGYLFISSDFKQRGFHNKK